MKHEEIARLIHKKLDREISPDEQRSLDKHLTDCPGCALLYEEMMGMDRSLKQLTEFYPRRNFNGLVLARLGFVRKYVWTRAAAVVTGAWLATLICIFHSPLPAQLLGRLATSVPALVRLYDKAAIVCASLTKVLAPFVRIPFDTAYPMIGIVLSILFIYFLGNTLQKEKKCNI
ncbi:zf-HC2 domain-containing protein [candidate division WOR-3 bacterium]|nr:zf-HC2 domain-containing protein [candidate division WOR-3 bacterium]